MSEYYARHDSEFVPYEPIPESIEQQLADEYENIRLEGIVRLSHEHFDIEDIEAIVAMGDEEEVLGFIYQRLLENGADPDEELEKFGITERSENV